MIATNCVATAQDTVPTSANERIKTVKTEGMRPNLILSRKITAGESRKLKMNASARGIKICRPRYSAAITKTKAIRTIDLDEAATLGDCAKK